MCREPGTGITAGSEDWVQTGNWSGGPDSNMRTARRWRRIQSLPPGFQGSGQRLDLWLIGKGWSMKRVSEQKTSHGAPRRCSHPWRKGGRGRGLSQDNSHSQSPTGEAAGGQIYDTFIRILLNIKSNSAQRVSNTVLNIFKILVYQDAKKYYYENVPYSERNIGTLD